MRIIYRVKRKEDKITAQLELQLKISFIKDFTQIEKNTTKKISISKERGLLFVRSDR